MQLTRQSMETLVETHGGDVMKVCFVYLGRYGLAEDAFQDTFLKVMEKWDSFQGKGEPRAWILQIARNTCRDQLRTAWFRYRSEYQDGIGAKDGETDPADPQDPQVELESREAESSLLKKIICLPLRYREVILLKAWFEMENSEIARILHIAEPTVRSRLKRAREKLNTLPGGELQYENRR